MIGGILYGLLTYAIVRFLNLSAAFAILSALFVSLFYVGSRLLILLSGIDSPYYSREGTVAHQTFEKDHLYQTTQWVGTFYHYHDIALLIFLAAVSVAFVTTLIVDLSGGKPMGNTFQDIWNFLAALSIRGAYPGYAHLKC